MTPSPIRRLRGVAIVFAATLAVALTARADHVSVHVSDAWSRATPPTAEVGAAYFSMQAHGVGVDRLVAVSVPVAERAELHTHVMEGALMKMRSMDAVEVHPQAPISFAPGGHHVMLMGLKAPLKEGDRFPMTLTFEKAGELVVEVQVMGPGAMSAGGHGSGGHGSASHSQMKADSDTMSHDHSGMKKH